MSTVKYQVYNVKLQMLNVECLNVINVIDINCYQCQMSIVQMSNVINIKCQRSNVKCPNVTNVKCHQCQMLSMSNVINVKCFPVKCYQCKISDLCHTNIQSAQIGLAHRLYTDFQYFFVTGAPLKS